MFTGIVTAVGRIASAKPHGDGLRLRIDAPGFGMEDVVLGDSISVQGVCHTVVAKDAGGFEVDTSRATLDVTTGLETGRAVNLEKSLRLADRLGGHLVQGHVDGVAKILDRTPESEWEVLRFALPSSLAKYVVEKGSITVDGVSLTVMAVDDESFSVGLIPATLKLTVLGSKSAGDPVNLEVDVIAKYVEKMLGSR